MPIINVFPVASFILIVEQFIVVILPVPGFNVNILALENDVLIELKLVTFNRFGYEFTILEFTKLTKLIL